MSRLTDRPDNRAKFTRMVEWLQVALAATFERRQTEWEHEAELLTKAEQETA